MNFGQLKALLQDSVQRQDLLPYYGEFINAALRDLQQMRSWLCMRWQRTFVIPAGQTSVALSTPEDGEFKELQHTRHSVYWVGDGGALRPVDVVYESAERRRVWAFGTSVEPRVFLTWEAAEPRLNVAVAPTTALTFLVKYYRYLPPLSADTDENWFTQHNRWLPLLTRAKFHAFSYVNDLQASVAESDALRSLFPVAGAEIVAPTTGQLGKTHLPLLEGLFNAQLQQLIRQEAAAQARSGATNM